MLQWAPGQGGGTYPGPASVHLQGTHCCHQHHHVGHQAGCSALDVEEFLHADVSTKAGFSDCGESSGKLTIIVYTQQDRVCQPLVWFQFKKQPKSPTSRSCPALRHVHGQRQMPVLPFRKTFHFLKIPYKLALSAPHDCVLSLL